MKFTQLFCNFIITHIITIVVVALPEAGFDLAAVIGAAFVFTGQGQVLQAVQP